MAVGGASPTTTSLPSLSLFAGRRDYHHVALEQHTDNNSNNENVVLQQAASVLEDEDDDRTTTALSVDECLERLGVGMFQYVILGASGLCFASDAIQVMMLSFLSMVLSGEWKLSSTASAFLTSLLFAGSLLGTLVLGPLADVIGRRRVFLMTASIITVFGFLMAFSSSYWILAILVFGVGIGIGGLTIPFDILAEVLPASHRGTHLLMVEYFWTLGVLYVVLLAYLTLDLNESNSNNRTGSSGNSHWREFVALCTLPCFVSLLVGYWFVPESARWLVIKGRTDEALLILQRAAAMNQCCNFDGDSSVYVLQHEEEEEKASFSTLFQPRWREITLRLWGAWAGFALGYYGTMLATTKVFTSRGSSETIEAAAPSSTGFDYAGIFISSSAEFFGTTLVIFTIDRYGRIPLQVVSYVTAGIAVFLLCFLSFRPAVIAAGFLARVFEMSATCVTWVSTAEMFTTEVRSTGHSSSNAMARIGAFFSPYIVQGLSTTKIGIIMLIVHAFTAICISKLPETAGTAHTGGLRGREDHVLINQHDRADGPEDIDVSLLFLSGGGQEDEEEEAGDSSSGVDVACHELKLPPQQAGRVGGGEPPSFT